MHSSVRDPLTGPGVLSGLRMSLHVAVGLLLVVGIGRMYTDADALWPGLVPVALFTLLYVLGTVAEERRRRRGSSFPRSLQMGWLFAVTAAWGLLVLHHSDFAWLAFPLFFLHIHLLPLRWGLGAVLVITAVVIVALAYGQDGLQVATVLGPSIGAVCAVVMALAYRTLRRENLAQQQALDELRRTREDLARSQREAGALVERERMARDIHDTLAQGLSSIVLVSRAAVSSLQAGDQATAAARLETVRHTAGENLQEARRLVRVLQTEPGGTAQEAQQEEPVVDRLQALCRRTQLQAEAGGARLSVRLDVQGTVRMLSEEVSSAVLRAVQSSLANVTQHADARTAVVTLSFLDDEVTLDIFDDGRGFDPAAVPVSGASSGASRDSAADAGASAAGALDGSGVGLRVLAQRAAAVGGTVEVESSPGEGTVVALRLPAARGGNTRGR